VSNGTSFGSIRAGVLHLSKPPVTQRVSISKLSPGRCNGRTEKGVNQSVWHQKERVPKGSTLGDPRAGSRQGRSHKGVPTSMRRACAEGTDGGSREWIRTCACCGPAPSVRVLLTTAPPWVLRRRPSTPLFRRQHRRRR
jgi:hypothetical protein